MSSSSVLFDAPGPRARRRHLIITIVAALVLLGVVVVALMRLDARGELEAAKWQAMFTTSAWQYYFVPGILSTLKAAGIAIVLSMLFGLVFGVGRLSQNTAIRWVSGAVVEFFRGIPVLIMMIAFFYFLAFRGVFAPETNPFVAVVAALTLYNGAVVAELVRSGVGSLPKGQGEAGLSIGLTPGQTMRAIQLPQAITAMLPALVSQLVVILKDSALGAQPRGRRQHPAAARHGCAALHHHQLHSHDPRELSRATDQQARPHLGEGRQGRRPSWRLRRRRHPLTHGRSTRWASSIAGPYQVSRRPDTSRVGTSLKASGPSLSVKT